MSENLWSMTNQGHEATTAQRQVEVGRWLSVVGGAALVLHGLSRRSLGGLGLAVGGGYLAYRGLTGHNPIRGVIDSVMPRQGVTFLSSITINKPVREVYAFWRRFENLPRFIQHMESVEPTGPGRYHWVVKPVEGMKLEWDIEVVEDRENQLIAWRSLPGSDIQERGWAEFKPAPGGRGTQLDVRIAYRPPGGAAGLFAAKLLNGITERWFQEYMRHSKQLMEAGEIATIEGQPSGRAEKAAAA
jgi:uncharacterized membrane protein